MCASTCQIVNATQICIPTKMASDKHKYGIHESTGSVHQPYNTTQIYSPTKVACDKQKYGIHDSCGNGDATVKIKW